MSDNIISFKILVLPGDGIGPEVIAPALRILKLTARKFNLQLTCTEGLVGGSALDATNTPLPAETLNRALESDAILMGAVGGPKWDTQPPAGRPEAALLQLRSRLQLFANLRPLVLQSALTDASPLKNEVVAGTDILLVRELTGGLYFGEPRGLKKMQNGDEEAWNTMRYNTAEIKRIVRKACEYAGMRKRKLCLADKANVLEASQLWRRVTEEVVADYNKTHPAIELTKMYADNAAMQLVANPRQFDVLVTENLFGDILSDIGAQLTGSIGLLPSASLGEGNRGLYEPVHGSAPDIAGADIANPCAAVLCVAMLLRHSLHCPRGADLVERAVEDCLKEGMRTADLAAPGTQATGCAEAGMRIETCLQGIADS